MSGSTGRARCYVRPPLNSTDFSPTFTFTYATLCPGFPVDGHMLNTYIAIYIYIYTNCIVWAYFITILVVKLLAAFCMLM